MSIHLFVGKVGSGKTTAMKVLCATKHEQKAMWFGQGTNPAGVLEAYLRDDSAQIVVLDDVNTHDEQAILRLLLERLIENGKTVFMALQYIGELKGLTREWMKGHVASVWSFPDEHPSLTEFRNSIPHDYEYIPDTRERMTFPV